MLRNDDGRIVSDDAAHFLATLFQNKTAESADVNILTVLEGFLNFFDESFQGNEHINLSNSRFIGDLFYQVSFSHGSAESNTLYLTRAKIRILFEMPDRQLFLPSEERKKITLFRRGLLRWYPQNRRSLPWAERSDPYAIWIREVVLQQTRLEQGLPYLRKLLQRFPDVKSLAAASTDEVLHLWQGLGYYSRARNLHAAARQVMDIYSGKLPATYEEWSKLSGVGAYTAAAIMAFAFNRPYAAVDGNVCRVLARAFGIADDIKSVSGKRRFQALADSVLDRRQPAAFNQAMMDFGSTVCKPRQPDCPTCFFRRHCYAVNHRAVHQLPRQQRATAVRNRYFAYCIFYLKRQQTYVVKRRRHDIYRGLYEFPLLEFRRPWTMPALRRRLQRLGWIRELADLKHVSKPQVHRLSHQTLHVVFLHLAAHHRRPSADWLKVPRRRLDSYAFPQIIRRYLPKICTLDENVSI